MLSSAPGAGSVVNDHEYSSGRYALMLKNSFAGWLRSTSGGEASADVVSEKTGPDDFNKKHLTGVKYQDITVKCGSKMSSQLYQWITDFCERKIDRMDGAVMNTDMDHKVVSQKAFTNALISEVDFPAVDAASKDACDISIKFQPEMLKETMPSSSQPIVGAVDQSGGPKWTPQNFRLNIDGLDCSKINKVDAIAIKQMIANNAATNSHDYQQDPSMLRMPNIIVTLPEASANSFNDWHQQFVMNGNNTSGLEKSGTLAYLATDGKELFDLHFEHLGVFKITSDKLGDGTKVLKVEMYVQNIKFVPRNVGF